MNKYICGIDLGIDGGVCILDKDFQVIDLIVMPTKTIKEKNPKYKPLTTKRKLNLPKKPINEFINSREVDCIALAKFLTQFNIEIAYIERVGSRPTDSKQSIVTFSKNCAYVTATLDILEIPYKKIEPKAWQKGILGFETSDKQHMIDYVAKHYPSVELRATPRSRTAHNGMSDALGIGLYGARLEAGK